MRNWWYRSISDVIGRVSLEARSITLWLTVRNWLVPQYIWRYRRGVVICEEYNVMINSEELMVLQYFWLYGRGVIIIGLDCSYTDVSKALRSSKKSVLICQSTRRSITSDSNVQQHCCKNSKSCFKSITCISTPSAVRQPQEGPHQHSTCHSSAFSFLLPVLHSTTLSQISLGCTLNSCLPEVM